MWDFLDELDVFGCEIHFKKLPVEGITSSGWKLRQVESCNHASCRNMYAVLWLFSELAAILLLEAQAATFSCKAELASVAVNNYWQGVQSNLLSRKLYVQKFCGFKDVSYFQTFGWNRIPNLEKHGMRRTWLRFTARLSGRRAVQGFATAGKGICSSSTQKSCDTRHWSQLCLSGSLFTHMDFFWNFFLETEGQENS